MIKESVNKILNEIKVTKEQNKVFMHLNEGGYYEPWWDSDHQMWHDNDGTCDYIDFDDIDNDNLKQELKERGLI